MTGFVGLNHSDGETAVDGAHPLPVSTNTDSTGEPMPADGLYDKHLTYNADNTIATMYFTDGVNTWTKTFTYTTGNVTTIGKWVKS